MSFLIDENLPYNFSLWKSDVFSHVYDLSIGMSDREIWEYARMNDLIIVTKDSDFSSRIMLSDPPPKVIHIRIGNMKIQELHKFLNSNWDRIQQISMECKLVNVYRDSIEGIA